MYRRFLFILVLVFSVPGWAISDEQTTFPVSNSLQTAQLSTQHSVLKSTAEFPARKPQAVSHGEIMEVATMIARGQSQDVIRDRWKDIIARTNNPKLDINNLINSVMN